MKRIVESIRKRPVNIVLMLCVVGLYLLNNGWLKTHADGAARLFFICYFNDLMCPLFFFSYANLLFLTVNREIHKLWAICLMGACTSLVWEFVAPVLKSSSTTDAVDILCYMVGSVIYWAILRLVRKADAGQA